mgnify:CR=1 FL=1
MRRGTSYLLLSVLLLLVLAVTVGACGSDDSATTTSAAATTTAPTSPATTSAPDTTEPASTDTTAAPPTGEAIELSIASQHAPTAPAGRAVEAWAERIKEATNGLVTMRHYGNSQLIAPPDTPDGIRAGTADIGNTFIFKGEPGFEVGVNLTQLVRGMSTADGVRIFDALWAEYADIMESQWKDFKVLWVLPSVPTAIFTVKQEVRTMEDMKGLQIRVPNAINGEIQKLLGAAPVSLAVTDWLASLDKGTTDGAATTVGSMFDFQIGEKFKYCTMFPLGNSINFMIMNKDKWNSLSPDVQKIIDDSLPEARQEMIDTWAQVEVDTRTYCEEKGIQFIDLAPDEMARWNEAIRPVFDKMAAEMDEAGYPGTEIVDMAWELSSESWME